MPIYANFKNVLHVKKSGGGGAVSTFDIFTYPASVAKLYSGAYPTAFPSLKRKKKTMLRRYSTLLLAVMWIRIDFNAYPDPAFYLNADPDPNPECQTDADPGQTLKSQEKPF